MSDCTPVFSPESNLEELLEIAESKYQTKFETLKIGANKLEILQFRDMEKYIEELDSRTGINESIELPFWAKIWPTSILLSYYLERLKIPPETHILEIGGGIGICGLFAAMQGYNVTISDVNQDALLFAQINILKNNLEKRAQTQKIDFTRDRTNRKYKFIIGSEALYREETYRPLIKFFWNHIELEPDSEIILANHYQIRAKKFFKFARQEFDIQEKTIGFRQSSHNKGDENQEALEKHLCKIFRLRPLRYVQTN